MSASMHSPERRQRIRAMSLSLGINTDILTAALRDAEDALSSLLLGVSAKAPLGPEHFLSWEKIGTD